jgi:hypothetical protein
MMRRKYLYQTFIIAGFCLLLLAALPAFAQETLYVVRDVAVDVSSDTATKAREIAHSQAKKDAFDILLKRLLQTDNPKNMPKFDKLPMQKLVQAVEVNSEKISRVRYLGNLNIFFRADQVRMLLADKNLTYNESGVLPQIIIPIYNTGDKALLWEEENIWRRVWEEKQSSTTNLTLIVPRGDPADQRIMSIGADSVATLDFPSIMGRYKANRGLIAVLKINSAPGAPISVSVQLQKFLDGVVEDAPAVLVQGEPGQKLEVVLNKTVDECLKVLLPNDAAGSLSSLTPPTGDGSADTREEIDMRG